MPATLLPQLLLAAAVASSAPDPTVCKTYNFQQSARLDVAAIKRLAREPLSRDAMTAGEVQLVVHPFDVEDHPIYGRWQALAVVYATRGDLAERTVGGVLFQERSTAAINLEDAQVVKIGDSVELRLPANRSCGSYTIRLQNNGTLLVQGRAVGRLR